MENLTELDVLKDVVVRLEKAGYNYMLTGSMAMNYYAEPRMTRDIDLVIALSTFDTQDLLALFDNDYYISDTAVKEAIQDQTMFNLVHLESVVKIDMIVRKENEYRLLEFSRRHQIEFSGFKFWIVSKEDLILSKLCWAKDSNSELQIRDIKNLLNVQPDIVYLRQWAEVLDVQKLFEDLMNE